MNTDSDYAQAGVQDRSAGTAAVWSLYLLETAAGALYTGISTDVARRLGEHASGRGAKALRGKGPLTLIYQQRVGTRSEAQKLEAAIKRLTVAGKRRWLAARLD